MRSGEGLWCAWVVVCACSGVLGAAGGDRERDARSCASVHDFFRLANLSADEPPHDVRTEVGTVCGGTCCSARREAALRAHVRRDVDALAAHTSRALHSLLATTRHALHDHVMELSKQSQNKTHMLFTQVYKNMAIHAHKPIEDLYSDIRQYIESNRTELDSAPARAALDLEHSAATFFRELFPLVYYKAAKQDWRERDFTGDYKNCLREAYKEVEPFGDIPRQISSSLSKSLEATRVLLQALALVSEVLAASDALLAEEWAAGGPCHAALLRMSYCGKCRGLPLHVKPCAGYCLNVLRGCVTWRVAELDAPWNSFVEGVQRLVTVERGPDGRAATGDAALRPLDSRISEAIMHAMENGINLEKKVKHACGHARLEEAAASAGGAPGALARPAAPGLARRDQLRVSPPDALVTHFLASIDKSKGFYGKLAESLCQDESFAEQNKAQQCWNGETVGQYTKTVVGVGASVQKYNPEVAVPAAAADDPRVASLADKLRHVRQVLVSQVSRAPPSAESFSYMQGDEAGGGGGGAGEGSGSGRDDYSDAEDDNYDAEGSGEGSGAIESTESKTGPNVRRVEPERPASARAARWCRPAPLLLAFLLMLLRRTLALT